FVSLLGILQILEWLLGRDGELADGFPGIGTMEGTECPLDEATLSLRQAQGVGNLLESWFPTERAGQGQGGTPPFVQESDRVHRETDHRRRVVKRVTDRLLDPEAGVGAEAGIETGIVPLGGGDQAQVTLADEILKVEAAPAVGSRDRDHQAK